MSAIYDHTEEARRAIAKARESTTPEARSDAMLSALLALANAISALNWGEEATHSRGQNGAAWGRY